MPFILPTLLPTVLCNILYIGPLATALYTCKVYSMRLAQQLTRCKYRYQDQLGILAQKALSDSLSHPRSKGRMWEAVGGCERQWEWGWEGVGGCGRMWAQERGT